MKEDTRIAIVGYPNCGKTTLFNALTYSKEAVGNWAGVTVDKCEKRYFSGQQSIRLVDLPGISSLITTEESTLDERITAEYLLYQSVDMVINVVDANFLERHLYLTLQLLEQFSSVVIVLHGYQEAKSKGKQIDLEILSKRLGCPIIPVIPPEKNSILNLQNTLETQLQSKSNSSDTHFQLSLSKPLQNMLGHWLGRLQMNARQLRIEPLSIQKPVLAKWMIQRVIEGDTLVAQYLKGLGIAEDDQELAKQAVALEADVEIAMIRHQYIDTLIENKTNSFYAVKRWISSLDDVVLHRFWGIPIFLLLMYCMFAFAIQGGGYFQELFNISSHAIFVDGLEYLMSIWQIQNNIIAGLLHGIGVGIHTVFSFFPVIGFLFIALSFLETSGYMARATFLIDRAMRFFGLSGQAFIPMLLGFGCNVPAVVATRMLKGGRERLVTVLVAPFMSCSARLAIYTVFVSVFFPKSGGQIILALYLIGVVVGMLSAFILKKSLITDQHDGYVITELPPYRFPSILALIKISLYRLREFVFKSGLLIIVLCSVISLGNRTIVKDNQTLVTRVSQYATPIFSPMGIQKDNWPAVVGLLTGLIAKEGVVGTLNALYQPNINHNIHKNSVDHIKQELKRALATIIPYQDKAVDHSPMSSYAMSSMYQRFDNSIAAFAYLIFVLLYSPCVSVIASIAQELNKKWALFSVLWTTGWGYALAVLFYQLATFREHWQDSLICITVVILTMLVMIFALHKGLRYLFKPLKRAISTPIMVG